MGRSKPRATISPIMPTENVGMVSGPIRKSRRVGRRMRPKGSVRPSPKIGQRPLFRGEQEFAERLRRDREAGITRTPEEESKLYKEMVAAPVGKPTVSPPMERGAGAKGFRQPPPGYKYDEIDRLVPIDTPPLGTPKPKFDPSKPSATMETRRVNVQDPTLGGPPEREVPIPRERRQRISRRSDPRGRAPFSPDERGMARDRFFERMFERSEERRQQRSMEREERDNVRDSLRSERGLRGSEDAGPSDERVGGGRRRRRGGGRRRRRGRRRDFTRRRSRMEGGRRGRSGKEMAAFRDQYVSTLR